MDGDYKQAQTLRSLDRVVGIVTKVRTGVPWNPGSISIRVKKSFSPPNCPCRFWTHPHSYLIGTGGSYHGGVKRPERAFDHSSQCSPLPSMPTSCALEQLYLLYRNSQDAYFISIGREEKAKASVNVLSFKQA